ncbi:MAG: chromosome segregation ATPase [Chlamydiales bacterium]|jgi:chromosome segregation ATPase
MAAPVVNDTSAGEVDESENQPKRGKLKRASSWMGRKVRHWEATTVAIGGGVGVAQIIVGAVILDSVFLWGAGTVVVGTSALGVYTIRKFKGRYSIAKATKNLNLAVDELQSENSMLKNEIERMREIFNKMVKSDAEFCEKLETASQGQSEIRIELGSLNGHMDQIDELTGKVDEGRLQLERGVVGFSKEVDEFEGKAGDLEKIVNQLGTWRDRILESYQELVTERQVFSKEIERLQGVTQSFAAQIDEIKKSCRTLQSSNGRLENRFKEVKGTSLELANTAAEYKRITQNFESLRQQIENSIVRVETYTEVLKNSKS